jgi:uncharacterized membrane protein HdeD (DUF308 family)
MLPVYFLSIALNALCGYVLAFGNEAADSKALSMSLNNNKVRLMLGGLSFITGILKILSPVTGNVPVVGDLFPALVGLAGGFILVFEFYHRPSENPNWAEQTGKIIKKYRKIIGFAAIAAAALHLFFYPVILL